jgi:hypothetical protein
MKLTRLTGEILIAILAMSLLVASSASATPLFRSSNVGATFLGLSLFGTLKAGSDIVTCEHDVFAGAIASVHLVGPFDIHFLGCTSAGSTKSGCLVGSPGVTPGLILTTTLHALLGLVLPSELPGLLVLPASGKVFVELISNECTPTTKVTGSVAGLLEEDQVGELVLESLVLFIPKDITKIDTLNGLVEPGLSAFSEEATFQTTVHITWHEDIEIT